MDRAKEILTKVKQGDISDLLPWDAFILDLGTIFYWKDGKKIIVNPADAKKCNGIVTRIVYGRLPAGYDNDPSDKVEELLKL